MSNIAIKSDSRWILDEELILEWKHIRKGSVVRVHSINSHNRKVTFVFEDMMYHLLENNFKQIFKEFN